MIRHLAIEAFADTMEWKLRKNRDKPCPVMHPNEIERDWQNRQPSRLLMRLYDEVSELSHAIDESDLLAIIEEAGDVGNFAMMIHDLAKQELEGKREKDYE